MDTMQRKCPVCDNVMAECDGHFTCAEHGNWFVYGANTLMRAPDDQAKAQERVVMPWEKLAPAF